MGSCCCKKPQVVEPESPRKYVLSTRPRSPRKGYAHIGVTNTDPSRLIRGFEDEPLVTLEEALQPFHGKIDRLDNYIKEAKTRCKKQSEHGLTEDESAAIFIYTNHWNDGCLYNCLEKAWESNNREKMKPWFQFLRLFKSGYDKLPNASNTVWQGTEYDGSIENNFRSGGSTLYAAMCLCSSSETEIMEYLKKNGDQKMILIEYAAQIAKYAAGYTADNSYKHLIFPGAKLAVTQSSTDSSGTIFYHLSKKLDPPKPDPPKSETKAPSTPREKHFVCQNMFCDYRCRGKHKEGHCSGFDHVHHECGHHCGEERECFSCPKDPNKSISKDKKHNSMARQCKTNNCKREAEAFCYHCSNDVCFKHYLEHKKEIQDQLPAFVDQVNSFYEQLKHKSIILFDEMPTFYTPAHDKLNVSTRRYYLSKNS